MTCSREGLGFGYVRRAGSRQSVEAQSLRDIDGRLLSLDRTIATTRFECCAVRESGLPLIRGPYLRYFRLAC